VKSRFKSKLPLKEIVKEKESFPGLSFKNSQTWKNPSKKEIKAERMRRKKEGVYNKKEFEAEFGKIEEYL